ncbi:MAG: F0F1 ATP synthase subunit alpha, partial [Actinomycetota bacterium]|nr:F0F1 ATP synthase subunit alpha [Actinomycetota bacterium]
VVLYAGTRGYLDSVPVADVKRFEGDLLDWFRARHDDLLSTIRSSGNLAEDDLKAALQTFSDDFMPSETVAE